MARHDALIATLLGDAPATPRLTRWLATSDGRREWAAHRRALRALDRLHGRSAAGGAPRRAWVCSLAAPIGRVHVAVTDAGLVRVAFRQREEAFAAWLRRDGLEVVRSPARAAAIVGQLRAYFAGTRRTFDVPLDLGGVTAFQRRVLLAATRVPPGAVVSYGEIARRIGRPAGSRAVGQALGRNPIPIVIPCHRVVAAGGRIGGYGGGLAVKRFLLRLEGAAAAGAR